MLFDERLLVREKAISIILRARNGRQPTEVRKFKLPKITFNAVDYVDMINWEYDNGLNPPLLHDLDENDLQMFVTETAEFDHIFNIPCHTQAVERCVKVSSYIDTKIFIYN